MAGIIGKGFQEVEGQPGLYTVHQNNLGYRIKLYLYFFFKKKKNVRKLKDILESAKVSAINCFISHSLSEQRNVEKAFE